MTDLVELPDAQRRCAPLTDNVGADAQGWTPVLTPPVGVLPVDIGDGVTLDGWMLKPPTFDPTKKYPVLVYVYGEPAGQTVRDAGAARGMLWHRMLARGRLHRA